MQIRQAIFPAEQSICLLFIHLERYIFQAEQSMSFNFKTPQWILQCLTQDIATKVLIAEILLNLPIWQSQQKRQLLNVHIIYSIIIFANTATVNVLTPAIMTVKVFAKNVNTNAHTKIMTAMGSAKFADINASIPHTTTMAFA